MRDEGIGDYPQCPFVRDELEGSDPTEVGSDPSGRKQFAHPLLPLPTSYSECLEKNPCRRKEFGLKFWSEGL